MNKHNNYINIFKLFEHINIDICDINNFNIRIFIRN